MPNRAYQEIITESPGIYQENGACTVAFNVSLCNMLECLCGTGYPGIDR